MVKIHGKEYVLVNERITAFKNEHKNDGRIITELLSDAAGKCVFKAFIYIAESLVATGHAYEVEGSSNINKTSYIENCETSAIGRALGILGYGIETSIASAEEVDGAIRQTPAKPSKTLHCPDCGVELYDNRVRLDNGSIGVSKSPAGKTRPAFSCKSSTCDFVAWDTKDKKVQEANK